MATTVDPNAAVRGVGGAVGEGGLVAIVWVFFATATIFVGLRLAVRLRQHRSLLSDDYWVIFAWACLLTMSILQMQQRPAIWYFTYVKSRVFLPKSQDEVNGWQAEMKRWQMPIIMLFYTVLWSVKASFLAIFRRLVQPVTILRRLWYAIAVFAVLGYLACILQTALACRPPGDFFTPGKCNSASDFWMQRFGMKLATGLDITTDLLIMGLPIAILPSLQLDLRRKIGLAAAFSLGFVIIAVSIVRMTQVTLFSGDAIDIIGLAVWGAIESCTAVIVGSLLPLKAVLSRRVRDYSSGRKNNANLATVMVAQSIPLDDMGVGNHGQKEGGIYVQRSYETTFDEASSREDDDEAGIITKIRPTRAV
ncbi:hypothetical protein N0V88_000223 [Collariella sp. IMI 366227]|nr:hypothetical protein N0V88_000223 [Collariella sp. IMI 366227]